MGRSIAPSPVSARRAKATVRSAISMTSWWAKSNSIARAVPKRTLSRGSRGCHRFPGLGRFWPWAFCRRLQASARFPRVPDFVSSCPLVKCAKASNGKRLGTSGKKIGPVPLRWAFAEAAVLFIRQNQLGKAYCAKLEHQHGTAKALTVLAHKLGRAGYDLRTREQAFALQRFVTA
jgi:hypothetical protein